MATEQPDANQHPPQKAAPRQKRRNDFNLGNVIGRGAFGQVIEVEDKETKVHYAMKVLSKAHIQREKKINYVKVERDVMVRMNHPNIVKLYLTFQDKGNLYYVVELASNGDLQKVLDENISIDIPYARIILGQTILALAHMHQRRVIHRDIKPENILLDSKNRVKITDFGTAKMFSKDEPFEAPRGSFVGSADYVPPETLSDKPINPSLDLWSFGCLVYHFLVGRAPFHTESNYATFQLIEKCEYTIPDFVPDTAKDLITKLLKINPKERLGDGEYDKNYESIIHHPFFEGIDWETLPHTAIEKFEPFPPAVDYIKSLEGDKESSSED